MASQGFLERCKGFFNEANGGKPLTPGALARAIRKASPSFKGTDQEIAEMFFEFDVNHDQLISWEEFENAVTAKDPKEITRAELEAHFKSFDKDQSGKLNRQEVKRLCQESGLKISDQSLDELFNEVDHNGDGEISYDEFLEAWFTAA